MVILYILLEYLSNKNFNSWTNYAFYIVLLNILILQVIVLYINKKCKKTEQLYIRECMQKEAQKIYYETLLKKEEKTKRFRHDISNHLIYIKELANENRNKDIVEYIENIAMDIQEIKNIGYFTGNEVVDVALNYYFSMLNKNIKVNISGYLENEIGVDMADMSIIFGNVFKNISEELRECKKGYVNIHINRGNRYIRIIVENSINKEKGDVLKKKKGINFGYGLENIAIAIERNKGVFEYDKTKEKYIVKITFKQLK